MEILTEKSLVYTSYWKSWQYWVKSQWMCMYGEEKTKHWGKKKRNKHLEGGINEVGKANSKYLIARKPNEGELSI